MTSENEEVKKDVPESSHQDVPKANDVSLANLVHPAEVEIGEVPLALPVSDPILESRPETVFWQETPDLYPSWENAFPNPALAAQVFMEEIAPPVESYITPSPETIETIPVPAIAVPQFCIACGALRGANKTYCDDCGFMFPVNGGPEADGAVSSSTTSKISSRVLPMASSNVRIKCRYEIGEILSENEGICRYKGIDHGGAQPVPVVILWAAPKGGGDPVFEGVPMATVEEEFMPEFDNVLPLAQPVGPESWPSLTWEKNLLEKAKHPSLPAVLDYFQENNFEFLVEESPQGRSLWEAWDEPESAANVRYGWLMQIAEAMQTLQKAGGLIEGIRPDFIVVTPKGQATIVDLSELLPLPIPSNPPIKATLYTSPELILTPHKADARAGLYSFGAMLYSLEYLHHSLEEKDFEHQFSPKQITERFPDVHPLFFRLLNKTFVRDLATRFPTDEAVKVDPSGFSELIKSLDVCRRNFDNVRLDIAAWTTTGMVRTGNEDAFALLHGIEARMDDLWEYGMVLLCDGMGGYEAGEIAAAMAIYEMRKYLLAQPIFASLTGKEPPQERADPKAYQDILAAALRHANREVYTASRTPGGKGRRGMGCTAECVYVDNKNVVVGHVGDSRTYHLSQGRLVQLTRDQTLVNRLVELGQLTEAEAEDHPRKNELQQAIGGQPDVQPGVYNAKLKRGDWVLVCSDGLTNHIPSVDLEKMLTRETAYSAEEAARRLLNLVNLRGATDNATIVVIRAS